jgi:flagellar biosynthesis protein FlhA
MRCSIASAKCGAPWRATSVSCSRACACATTRRATQPRTRFVRDTLAGEGRLQLGAVLAVADEGILDRLGGDRVREPVYGLAASWIAQDRRETATANGALVFDPISVVGSHLSEIAREHAAELLGRQELHTLLEHLRASVPSLVKELGGEALPFATVHRVFEALLRERVWPRDTVATLEALVDASSQTREPRELVEAVRRRLVPAHVRRRSRSVLEPLVIEPGFEAELTAWLVEGAPPPHPDAAMHVRARAAEYLARVPRERSAIVCTAALRPALADLVRRFGVRADVYAFAELPADVELRPAMILERPAPAAALASR